MTDIIEIIPLSGFRRATKKLFSEAELAALFEFLGNNPEKGDVIAGTGGIRKLRWALAGSGKRGGSRVIYYYHRPEWQILLLTAYAKNEKEDLQMREKKLLAALIKEIVEQE
ncbi:MAG: type II toxin-antitoxin system RelE/ParE family toxin [Alphaproteobacteria bacterium]|nr:type II toxin-antitoxin system RelE/ParE family toxin [Alphaproteobacteria bacterium]